MSSPTNDVRVHCLVIEHVSERVLNLFIKSFVYLSILISKTETELERENT